MKVVDVERIVVDVPFTERQARITEREVYNWSILELCRVTTDTGLTGWGETVIHYTWARVTDDAVNRVIGKSPADVMNDDTLGAGLQMALFDVAGKALGVPCYKLLGNKVRDWSPISWWSIDASPGDWLAEARDAVALGYTSFKIKQRPWWDIFAQVDAISTGIPSSFKLDLDANATMQNAAAAMPIMQKLAQHENVAMFESPIPQTDILGNRQLKQVIPRPIAMHFGSPPYMTALREEVCDGFVVCAGKSEVMRQGHLSAEANMPFWLQLVGNGLTTTWAAHLGAVLTHATWPAITCINLYSHHLLTKPVEVAGGFHRVPEEPGLGVTVDEEAVEKWRVPDETVRELNEQGELYDKPKPRIICSVVYPDGTRIHIAPMNRAYGYFIQGNGPAHADGVELETVHDDGSKEWSDLYERALEHPVRSRGQEADGRAMGTDRGCPFVQPAHGRIFNGSGRNRRGLFMIKIAEILSTGRNTLWDQVKQIGVDHVVTSMPPAVGNEMGWEYMPMLRMKNNFNDAGFDVAVIESTPPMLRIKLGLEGREEELDDVCTFIESMGRVGIKTWCYNWMAVLNWTRTSSTVPSRGGAFVTGYDHAMMKNAPLTDAGEVSENQLWETLHEFLERVTPVAEQYGVEMAMHPDDPPLSPLRGIGRIMRSLDNYQKLLDLVPSPMNGITFCQGNFALMTDDQPAAIRHFGAQRKIFFVHFRDVRGDVESYVETFHDDGPTDMMACLRAYRDIGFEGVLRPDHVPTLAGEDNDHPGYSALCRLYAVGYIRGLREAVYREDG